MHPNEQQLIKSFQQGKYHAFETLYEQQLPRVYRYLFYQTNGNQTLTQDLCSETFLAAFEALDRFETGEKSNFGGWLLRIAHHKYVDHIRKQKENLMSLDEELIPNKDDQILYSLDIEHQAQKILDFLQELGTEKKEIVQMRLRENLNYEEISILLGKTPEACRKLFSRTMKTLAEHFGK